MKLSLLVMTPGKQEGKILDIKLPQFLIGRDPQCHLRPASPLISKRHCALIQRDGKAFIRDFGSTNGTYVNEERVEGERELHHDDQLKVGPISFTVRLDASAKPATSNTPAPATKPAGTKTPVPALKTQEQPAPSKSSTPAPATTSKVASGADDDDIMSMLMELDDGEPRPADSSASPDGVPDGSTVMDLKLPPEAAGAQPGEGDKPGQPAKPVLGDTRSAAAKILEKMTKRPRT